MKRFQHTLLFVVLVFNAATLSADDTWNVLTDLRGQWKFQPGDNSTWSDPALDEKDWEDVFVPAPWEEEGYPGYDGYAWYRKHFKTISRMKDGNVYLQIGYVDDVCEVYLNGHLVGFSGIFPPHFTTAYNTFQRYPVPTAYFNFNGNNVVAIRVYDQQLGGGIVSGKIGFVEPKENLKLDIDLAGVWRFHSGDDLSWKERSIDETGWSNILVPAIWDAFGLREYDGFGWYRVRFTVPPTQRNKNLMLLLGKIDDIDEVYLNGERIGRTGRMRSNMAGQDLGSHYQELRAYPIPTKLLLGGENVLAVRVYDGMLHGGIYEGPVGIVPADRYQKLMREKEDAWKIFDWFK
ncbi:MAG: beta galactosidase jelly roll domain-containing protein [Bacteroidota bacterium]